MSTAVQSPNFTDLTDKSLWQTYYDDYQKEVQDIVDQAGQVQKQAYEDMDKLQLQNVQTKLQKWLQ